MEPRRIETDTERVISHRPEHYEIIDLGSNSIRLVVYDDSGRAPFPQFNEKSFVAFGAGLAEEGCFTKEAFEGALAAIRRLDAIAIAIDLLATEAIRKAKNLYPPFKKKLALNHAS